MRRTIVLVAVLCLGGFAVWVHGAPQGAQVTPPPPTAFNPANFVGTVTPRSNSDIRMNRYHFDPGARTNWHNHDAGQVIFVEQGRLRVQDKGQQTREFAQGSTFHTAPGVTHWHGSSPEAGVTQVSLSFGVTNWMEKVSDEDFRRRSAAALTGPKEEAQRVVEQWAAAFRASDVDAIVSLYAPDAMFLGTGSRAVVLEPAGIRTYFEQALLTQRPRGATLDSYSAMEVSDTSVVITGLDTTTAVRDGKPTSSPGRVTFVVAKRGADWKIVHFHRSGVPGRPS
jgi:uncharacterized protein (TIGR02246 family)